MVYTVNCTKTAVWEPVYTADWNKMQFIYKERLLNRTHHRYVCVTVTWADVKYKLSRLCNSQVVDKECIWIVRNWNAEKKMYCPNMASLC